MNQAIGGLALAVMIGFVGFGYGYGKAEDKYLNALAEAKTRIEVMRHESEQKLADAITKRDEQITQARTDADALRRTVERLRRSQSVSRGDTGNDPCLSPKASLARCERLLGEGLELLAEGGELLRSHAADHDAIAKMK